jgi:hypothetical protein
MNRLLDNRSARLGSATAPLSFVTTGQGARETWDRFIAVSGENIYHLGNVCGTCMFFFSKLKEQEEFIPPQPLIDRLNAGLSSIEGETLETLSAILPLGQYEVLLLTLQPRRVEPGQAEDYFSQAQVENWGIDPLAGKPHSPRASYYICPELAHGINDQRFEFVIPLTSPEALDIKRVNQYKTAIEAGLRPTAVSLSVLDVKTPSEAYDPSISMDAISHYCLAHYLLDGHHKVRAASELGAEITLLAFVAVDKGVSSVEEIGGMMETAKLPSNQPWKNQSEG